MDTAKRINHLNRLAIVTREIANIEKKLKAMKLEEGALYSELGMSNPDEKKEKRFHISVEKALQIQDSVIAASTFLASRGMSWCPMQVIVRRVIGQMPEAERKEVEAQIRKMVADPNSAIEHNGYRGNGSSYRLKTGSEVVKAS